MRMLLTDPVGKFFIVREKALYWLSAAFFATLFAPPSMPVINDTVIWAMAALCVLYNPLREKWRLLRVRPAVVCMLLFFVLEVVSAAASADQARGWATLAKRASLFVFPLTIGLITIGRDLKDRILLAYSVLIVTAAGCCLADAVHRTFVRHDSQWLYDDSLTMLIGRTSVYMALLVVLAIFSLGGLLGNGFLTGRWRWTAYGGIGLLLFFHYLLASRTSMFFLYGTIVVYGVYYVFKDPRPGRKVVIISGMVILVLGSLCLFPKTLSRFRQLQYTSYDFHSRAIESHYNMKVTPDQWNGANFRLAVWSCGWAMARRHPITGVPLGDKQARLMDEYKARDFMFAYDRHRNLHSTWLDVLVNTGIPGLAIFLLAYLILPISTAIKNHDWLGLAVVGTFASAMITETWIDGSFGTILLAFWISLVCAWGAPAQNSYEKF
jgi:O-antigen ligase